MTAPKRKKHTIGEYMTSKSFLLLKNLRSSYTHKTMWEYNLSPYSIEELCSVKEILEIDKYDGYQDIIYFIEIYEINRIDNNAGFRDTPYEHLPMRYIDGEYKRLYLTGQLSTYDHRARLFIDNDYVLTNDNELCIDTEEILTREFLLSLEQKQIQGSNWSLEKSAHIFLPIPREEAKHQKQRFVKDKNNIAKYRVA